MDAIAWIAEQRIREAMDQGLFDNSPYRGRPVRLEENESIAPELRMAFKVLKDAGCLPPEVELRREIASLVRAARHDRRRRGAKAPRAASSTTAFCASSCSAATAETAPEPVGLIMWPPPEAPCD